MKKKAAEALRMNPLELTQDDLLSLQGIGHFKRKSTGKVCIVARAEFPCFIWRVEGIKAECMDGDYIVLDEDGEITIVNSQRFESYFSAVKSPSFSDTAKFVPAPAPQGGTSDKGSDKNPPTPQN